MLNVSALMKILYLCPDLGIPVLGRKGASVHVRELIGAFARAGHRVTLAAQTLIKSPTDEPAKVKARVIHIPSDPAATSTAQALKNFHERLGVESPLPGELRRICYNDTLYRELKRRFLKHKPGFIYERASLYATAGARLAEKFKVPHIVELNAPLAVEQSAYRATGFGELAAQAERWTLTRADAVIVVSTELGKHVRALGVPAKKIHVMPNGVNPELFSARGLQSASASVSSRRGKVQPLRHPVSRSGLEPALLGFVGGLRPWHGVEILPQLLARLSKRHPAVRLIIAGDGQLRSALEREFKRRRLSNRVTFTGALLHEEIPGFIRQFDIALAPYPRHDHDFYFSPLKLFEYMACGVAVVASDVGQISEVVRHAQTGLLYPAGNFSALVSRCETLLANEALRARLGAAAAREVARKFTWDINAAKVAKIAKGLRP
ncbi:MAG: glycosyltransferase family 1 protein [Verrucomicrobia bacterium]|nr:MAG: glycosyltransferase family 1 protein [Verrucomicrobiota bacterium]